MKRFSVEILRYCTPQVAAGGGVTVRPPRPATIYALAQRLRARSESQREEHCPPQESYSEGASHGQLEGVPA